MRLTFHAGLSKYVNGIYKPAPGGTHLHTACKIGLEMGDQGIPRGFELTALCGVTTTCGEIDLFGMYPGMFPVCPECRDSIPG